MNERDLINLDDYEFVPESSNFQKGLGYAGELVKSAAQAPFALGELGSGLVKKVLPEVKYPKGYEKFGELPDLSPSKRIAQQTEKTFGKYEPIAKKGGLGEIAEKTGLYTAATLPAILSGGLPDIGLSIGGSAARAATENVTENPFVLLLTDVMAQRGLRSASKLFKNLFNDIPKKDLNDPTKIQQHINDIYKKSDELGSSILAKPQAKKINHELNKIHEDLMKEYVSDTFDKSAKKRVLDNLSKAEDALFKPNVTLTDLANEEKILNKHYSPFKNLENDYFKRIKNVFTNNLKEATKEHKDWGKYYNNSKNLYIIDKWQSNLGKWAEEESKKGVFQKIMPNKIAQGAIGAILGYGSGSSKLGLATAGIAYPLAKTGVIQGIKSGQEIERARRFMKELKKTQEGEKLLAQIVTDSANNNTQYLLKDMRKLNSLADKYEKENPEEELIDLNEYEFV